MAGLAGLAGISFQQLQKYERGTNGMAAGRLFAVARALGVGVDHFYEGLGGGRGVAGDPRRRTALYLAHHGAAIADPRRREALRDLVRVLAGAAADTVGGHAEPDG